MGLFQTDAYGNLTPAAHTHDPASSHEAARRHTESGKRGRNQELVLALVQQFPGSTAVELWENAGDDNRAALVEMQEIRRRLTDLKDAGLVRNGEIRACKVKGSSMTTWIGN